MRRWKTTVGLVAVLGLMVAACGDDDDEPSASTTTSSDSTAPTEGADLDRFLALADEVAGLSPSGEPTRLLSLAALADEFGVSAAEQQRLEEHGFQSTVTQRLDGPSAAGITAVDVFATEEGAASELEYLRANKETDAPPGIENFVEFEVPGVPTAIGWTFDKPGGSQAADVHWTQGRCMLSLGSEPPSLDELRAGVMALYERTDGQCP